MFLDIIRDFEFVFLSSATIDDEAAVAPPSIATL